MEESKVLTGDVILTRKEDGIYTLKIDDLILKLETRVGSSLWNDSSGKQHWI